METHFSVKFYILKHLVIHFSFYVVSLYIYWKSYIFIVLYLLTLPTHVNAALYQFSNNT